MEAKYLSEEIALNRDATSKARVDAEEIFKDFGLKPVTKKIFVRPMYKGGLYYLLCKALSFKNVFIRNRANKDLNNTKNEIIFIQYPFEMFNDFGKEVNELIENNKIVFLIHDVTFLRRDGIEQEKEVAILNKAHALICHNDIMKSQLQANGVTVKNIVSLEIFDYLSKLKKTPKHVLSNEIVFAGNLAKSKFVKKLDEVDNLNLKVHLFGRGASSGDFKNLIFHGSKSPNKLIKYLNQSFGLVWDGDEIETCAGNYGQYLKINNPHKVSLYLVANMPVIVWKQSAMAEFVEKHGVGIAVDSLLDIEKEIALLTEERYQEMLDNVSKIRKDLISGNYLKHAIDKVLNLL